MENLTNMIFIIDKSGSMGGLEKETITGFNEMISKQKMVEGKAIVSLVLFDHEIKPIYKDVDLEKVSDLTLEDYNPSGCTALLDAIGETLMITKANYLKLKENKPEKTIVTIITDGYENSSKEFSYESINNMIEKSKLDNFEFVFLGANIDVAKEATKLGININNSFNFECNSKGIMKTYDMVYESVAKLRKKK